MVLESRICLLSREPFAPFRLPFRSADGRLLSIMKTETIRCSFPLSFRSTRKNRENAGRASAECQSSGGSSCLRADAKPIVCVEMRRSVASPFPGYFFNWSRRAVSTLVTPACYDAQADHRHPFCGIIGLCHLSLPSFGTPIPVPIDYSYWCCIVLSPMFIQFACRLLQ